MSFRRGGQRPSQTERNGVLHAVLVTPIKPRKMGSCEAMSFPCVVVLIPNPKQMGSCKASWPMYTVCHVGQTLMPRIVSVLASNMWGMLACTSWHPISGWSKILIGGIFSEQPYLDPSPTLKSTLAFPELASFTVHPLPITLHKSEPKSLRTLGSYVQAWREAPCARSKTRAQERVSGHFAISELNQLSMKPVSLFKFAFHYHICVYI